MAEEKESASTPLSDAGDPEDPVKSAPSSSNSSPSKVRISLSAEPSDPTTFVAFLANFLRDCVLLGFLCRLVWFAEHLDSLARMIRMIWSLDGCNHARNERKLMRISVYCLGSENVGFNK